MMIFVLFAIVVFFTWFRDPWRRHDLERDDWKQVNR
jgi:hypothetical protein